MILYFFIIPLNVILLIMMGFLMFAFYKEKGDENKIKNQMEQIKITYEQKTAEYEATAKDSQAKMEEALKKAEVADAESKRVSEDAETKIFAMQQTLTTRMDELNHLEESIKTDAEKRIQEFEKKQKEEVEKNMVSLVMNVTQEVFKKTLSYEDHTTLIKKSIEEMKFED